MLGRPPLIHEADIDQQHPDRVDDNDLMHGISESSIPAHQDSIIEGSILHGRLVRIVRKAARELYSIKQKSEHHKAELAAKLTSEVRAWHASLPVILSGAVHASSVIPLFRRQITVLNLAHAHALMFINRPLLVVDTLSETEVQPQVTTCLDAAKAVMDLLSSPVADTSTFPAFWFTQYVAFNALSIIYVSIIRRRRRGTSIGETDEQILQRAEGLHGYLAQATPTNAPSLRYSVILEELRQEATRPAKERCATGLQLAGLGQIRQTDQSDSGLEGTPDGLQEQQQAGTLVANDNAGITTPFEFGNADDFLTLEPDLWLQLDAFPFCELSQWDAC
jgi:hypothetical protein